MSDSHTITARQITLLMLFYTGDTDTLNGMADEYVVSVFMELKSIGLMNDPVEARSKEYGHATYLINGAGITPQGKVYIEHLLTRPLPVQSWAIPTV